MERDAQKEPLNDARASDLVVACEASWRAIQSHHPELPDVVMLLGTGVERGRLVKLGHWWDGRERLTQPHPSSAQTSAGIVTPPDSITQISNLRADRDSAA